MVSKRRTRNWILVALYVVVSLFTQALTVGPEIALANPDVPITNAMIVASGDEGYGFNVTNALGKYILTQGLTAGTYNVTAMAEGYIMQELGDVNVVVGSETGNVNFSLRRSGGISGKVTASNTGKGIANIIITAYTESSYGWYAITDADGNYKMITNLATGTYNVTVSLHTGYFGKTVSGVKVTAG
ncbi:MAG: carboxypeptidase-like regulatory domain-containing protein, partial [Candidatus Bathyarchaeota archaeon]|nr:carboxypeptidase-like regulatory domain-containing protein [Candidatus Bathyarchaeota archaeon]